MTKIFQRGKKLIQLFFTAWSFSRWKDYRQCPAYAKYKFLEKRPEPDHPASARGTEVHESAEGYVSGKLKKLPEMFKPMRKDLDNLKKVKAKTEQEWAFDAQWCKVDWFAKDAWLRIKVDSHYLMEERKRKVTATTVHIIDYKTGKVHGEHEMQRSLYALGALLVYPDAVAVVVEHWYMDSGEIHQDEYRADQLEALKKEWTQRTVPMMRDRRFAPRPGNYCRWCHFRKGNNGPCKF